MPNETFYLTQPNSHAIERIIDKQPKLPTGFYSLTGFLHLRETLVFDQF
ncbi:hypothetical protein VIBNISFn118_560037 [Vibrio nigripulchritudo SFn118]|nr:hypothetical protein VIBNISFn118_560037 [Vibrio nigripulchritudo SFn118]